MANPSPELHNIFIFELIFLVGIEMKYKGREKKGKKNIIFVNSNKNWQIIFVCFPSRHVGHYVIGVFIWTSTKSRGCLSEGESPSVEYWSKTHSVRRPQVRRQSWKQSLVDDLMLKLYMKNKSTINTKWIVGLYEINHKSFLHLDCLSRMLVLMTAGVFGW